ncbi:SET domain-containing protein [Piedraia hortae CBS 480.64]|uniref:SET domain-containing protein n=1 Tax=Piedraia hortae CBS 480.64 TaxID=1314780 RepID=A0A6A7BXG5_9PEZI|nr:SET domain-containing protein [Piedraia hortae CBS 480.64]
MESKPSETTKMTKNWLQEGLYVGKDNGARKRQHNRKYPSSRRRTNNNRFKLNLPMFKYMEKQRDFTIPYEIFSISATKAKPKGWHRVSRNRLIGDAKSEWANEEQYVSSACNCKAPEGSEQQPGCGDLCINRVMQYECSPKNCKLSPEACGNRPFAELAARLKKGGAYDIGVEIIQTADRGFGVRACRSFAPGQIIMEYTGEVITEDECQRRIREDYKDVKCYYLMELAHGLIIDGMKGNMARFINHSCEPNCEIRMVTVNGMLRLGVFAGDDGVSTGDELTYDYNFETCADSRLECYCGTPSCRGFLTKRRNLTELRLLKKEAALKRKAEEDAVVKTPTSIKEKVTVAAARTIKTPISNRRIIKENIAKGQMLTPDSLDRNAKDPFPRNLERKADSENGPPTKLVKASIQWFSWVPEAQLQSEKAAKDEAAKQTARALRLAAREKNQAVTVQVSQTTKTNQKVEIERKMVEFRMGENTKKIERVQKAGKTRTKAREKVTTSTPEVLVMQRPTRVRKMPPRMMMLLGE